MRLKAQGDHSLVKNKPPEIKGHFLGAYEVMLIFMGCSAYLIYILKLNLIYSQNDLMQNSKP
jgi:hypothetical protein